MEILIPKVRIKADQAYCPESNGNERWVVWEVVYGEMTLLLVLINTLACAAPGLRGFCGDRIHLGQCVC